MRYFFTADEHYGHANIIKYTGRPFADVEEMDAELIRRHNAVVGPDDVVVHAGDFALVGADVAGRYIEQLRGQHVFLQGSHDRWGTRLPYLWERTIDDVQIVVCHYPMLSWPRSHYGSYLLHGHTHGRLRAYPGILDIGVDSWDFAPASFEEVRKRLWR